MMSIILILKIVLIYGLDNGIGLTPPMGWMTWERFRCQIDCENRTDCLNEDLIKAHADILAQPEWKSLGYEYLNIDDCWPEMERDSNDRLVADKSRFPSGMKDLSAYLHSKNLKLGTYNDMGTKTCGGYPGECKDENCTLPGYMSIDADTYAAWGIVCSNRSLFSHFHTHTTHSHS